MNQGIEGQLDSIRSKGLLNISQWLVQAAVIVLGDLMARANMHS